MMVATFLRVSAARIRTRIAYIGVDLNYWWHSRDRRGLAALTAVATIVAGIGGGVAVLYQRHVDNRNLTCLALNVYYEARGESREGQQAVAEVTMNRVASRHYPNSVCEVVYQKNWDRRRKRLVSAFSWTELNAVPKLKGPPWYAAWAAAEEVFYNRHTPKANGALFYHAKRIKPRWASQKRPVARIGEHVFY